MVAHAESVAVSVSFLRYMPLWPLLGVLFHVSLGERFGRRAVNLVACATVFVSFTTALRAFLAVATGAEGTVLVDRLYVWIATGELTVPLSFQVDALAAVMCMVVTGVGFLIHVYSTGYMAHDDDFARFFAYLNLFMAAMLVLVLADTLPVMFVGWEGVGLCSYLLIGFWYKDVAKSSAGKKAFLVNRVGDAAFLLGMFLLFWTLAASGHPSLAFADINHAASSLPRGVAVAAALLLFVGATGKSAQIPLFVWLPDAMAGPTPVSALIHAATMVTAGVYMIARLNGLYMAAPEAMDVVAVVGALTALAAATVAVAQTDIKKVLAYSTISQLGYMFLALGVGAFAGAIFHLMTHAFFKALLFLGAGSVIHGLHDEQDIRKMGGLRAKMPRTFLTFAIATLAIAGVPGLSGFFSKDEILASVFAGGFEGLWFAALLTAGLTAFYMTRLLVLTFYGEFRGGPRLEAKIHESPASMTVPLMALAVLAVVGGWVGIPAVLGGGNAFGVFLAPSVGHHELGLGAGAELGLMAASVIAALGGIAVGWRVYSRDPGADAKMAAGGHRVYETLGSAYYVDAFYERAIAAPVLRLSNWAWRFIDVVVIDGIANGVAGSIAGFGGTWRRWATGNVQHYLLTVLIGAAVLALLVGTGVVG